MPKRTDIKSVMVIGSGPIVIGQAAEFDYSGTQACRVLREEGIRVILVNSNPATIMTDPEMADATYIEPISTPILEQIIAKERPDALLPTLGGQTALNAAMALGEAGVLKKYNVELIGASLDAIDRGEDRELFKELCQSLGEPVLPSEIANTIEEGVEVAARIGYPVVLRPAFTLGGTGGGFADNEQELRDMMRNALFLSPVHQVLIEKSIKGYKEIEYEVMRDSNDTAIAVCNMENIDPVGIHTGDSIVVAPSQTLTNREYQMLRDSALKIIRALKIEGGCNVQFALDPLSFKYYLIEVNPRVSRSSALASKASGYPIARVSAKIAVGLTLDEIQLANTPASFEPTLDYVVTKIARFPFDKFSDASNKLGTQMKATGEVMSVGRTVEESLLKAVRSLETGVCHIYHKKFDSWSNDDLLAYIKEGTDDRLYAIAQLIRGGVDLALIYNNTKIDMFFLEKFKNIVEFERVVAAHPKDIETLRDAKRMGFSDKYIGQLWGLSEHDMYRLREQHGIFPVYKMIDTCASEFSSYVPYFYSTYEDENESVVSDREKIVVLGSGPIRIGQGVEFDYSTVHAIWSIREAGYEAIIINNNPETVSTDYTTSDKLYFEPLTLEDVLAIHEKEKPVGVIAQFGGQTPLNLAGDLKKYGVNILGTSPETIDLAEDRDHFRAMMEKLGIPMPESGMAVNVDEALEIANRIGYPVMVRPSYVLGGRGMEIVHDDEMMKVYMSAAVGVTPDRPILIDRFLHHATECEADAISDGKNCFVPAVMEHIELAGVHSGDSACILPSKNLTAKQVETIKEYTRKIAVEMNVCGLMNMQYAIEDDTVYVLEANPRASRTVPLVSKVCSINMVQIATQIITSSLTGKPSPVPELRDHQINHYGVKEAVFPFNMFPEVDPVLGPEMRSTGEVLGISPSFGEAYYKAQEATRTKLPQEGTVLLSVCDRDKPELIEVAKAFNDLGFKILATGKSFEMIKEAGIPAERIFKMYEGRPNITDAIANGDIQLIINTPAGKTSANDDSYIRKSAIRHKVPYITTMAAAKASIEGIKSLKANKHFGVKSIQAHHADIK